jgi:hypothetical protein
MKEKCVLHRKCKNFNTSKCNNYCYPYVFIVNSLVISSGFKLKIGNTIFTILDINVNSNFIELEGVKNGL